MSEDTVTRIIVRGTRVMKCAEEFQERHSKGHGDLAVFTRHSIGWYVLLEGSHEALFVGYGDPGLREGDLVRITIEKE